MIGRTTGLRYAVRRALDAIGGRGTVKEVWTEVIKNPKHAWTSSEAVRGQLSRMVESGEAEVEPRRYVRKVR